MTRCFIVSLLQNPKQVDTVLSLFAVGIFFFFFFCTVYSMSCMSMRNTTSAWSMVFLASGVVSLQALSCYRDSC